MAQYDSYILRVWRSTGDDGLQWAGRLEHLQQGKSWSFSKLDELLDHLRQIANGISVTSQTIPSQAGADAESESPGLT